MKLCSFHPQDHSQYTEKAVTRHVENLGMGHGDKDSNTALTTVGACMAIRGVQKELIHSDVHQLGILFHGSTETKVTWERNCTKTHIQYRQADIVLNSCLYTVHVPVCR